jgi:hypothetical protein
MNTKITQGHFTFAEGSEAKKRKIVDDVRNILIVEFLGDKAGELQAKELFEELVGRGLKVKIMS